MPSDIEDAARLAAISAASGGMARIALAMHGGQRGWLVLAIEGMLGATLGVMAAAGAVYFDASLWDGGRPLLVISGTAGCAGALGTRLLDAVMARLEMMACPPGWTLRPGRSHPSTIGQENSMRIAQWLKDGLAHWQSTILGAVAALLAWLGLHSLGVAGIDQMAAEAEALGRLATAAGNAAPLVLAAVGLLWRRS